MPKFIIERDLSPGQVPSDDQIREDSLKSLQVLRELAQHAGHADILREQILDRRTD